MTIKKPSTLHDDVRLPKGFSERLENCSLTDDEKEAILERASAQVQAEEKKRLEEEFFQYAVKKARSRHLPAQEQQDIVIDLPGHAVNIMIDGVEYLHAFTYREPKHVCDTLREIMQRAWNHEEEVGGANRSFYHQPSGRSRPRGIQLSRHHQGVDSRQILRGQ